MKNLRKLGLSILGTHTLITLVLLIAILLISSSGSMTAVIIITVVALAVYWVFMYAASVYYGERDLKRGDFDVTNGFKAGLIADIPSIIFFIISIFFYQSEIVWLNVTSNALMRIWHSPYTNIFNEFGNLMPWIGLLPIIILPLGIGFSYLDGRRRRAKTMKIIEDNDTRRGEISKTTFDDGRADRKYPGKARQKRPMRK